MDSRDPASRQTLASHADREAVIERLTHAYANDVLDLDEFERRASSAYSTVSRHELVALTADLPSVRAAAGPSAAARRGEEVGNVSAMFASIARRGTMSVPRQLEVRALFGSVELDLACATFLPGVTEIVVRAMFGSIQIVLPADVTVENAGKVVLGSFECHAAAPDHRAPRAVCTVRITGRAILSSVEID